MTDRIEQIVSVVRRVLDGYSPGMTFEKVRDLRIDALNIVAAELGIQYTTVSNKYRRGLVPDIEGTHEFDVALYEWVSSSSERLKSILLKHSLTEQDRVEVSKLLGKLEPPTPVAADIEEPSNPGRVSQEVYRVLRDTVLARSVKQSYDYRCQICSETIELAFGRLYAEAHHLRPLGQPHNGPDVRENIVCVCPKHHVLLDYGAIMLDTNSLGHVDPKYIQYHNTKVYLTNVFA